MNCPLPETLSRKIRAAMVPWAVRLPQRMSSERSPERMGVPPKALGSPVAWHQPEEQGEDG